MMDTYLPLPEAAIALHVDQSVVLKAIESGKLRAAMLPTGAYLVNAKDLNQPLRKEDTAEWNQVSHFRGVGIGVRQAAEKYNIPNPTVSRWVDKGLIRKLSGETLRGQRVIIDEADVAYCAIIYHRSPGQGKKLFNPDGTPHK
jgi:predicted site-specific integrase-resolvase